MGIRCIGNFARFGLRYVGNVVRVVDVVGGKSGFCVGLAKGDIVNVRRTGCMSGDIGLE